MDSQLVIIIGAGLSGLVLAQGLRKHSIPYRLYEQDASLSARPQGYRVRIAGHGIRAFEACLSEEHSRKLHQSCATSTATSNVPQASFDVTTGKQTASFGSDIKAVAQTEIPPWSMDRGVARQILSEGIDIIYGKKMESFEEVNNTVIVNFTDSTTVTGAVLVGADGAWSKVRKQVLPHYQLLDTEGVLTYGKAPAKDAMQHLPAQALRGLTALRSEKMNGILEFMHFDESTAREDYVYWGVYTRKDDYPQTTFKERVQQWQPEFRAMINLTDDSQISSYLVLSTTPEIPHWRQERVTLIGDAIHTMAPTSAIGATTALRDAALLVQCLVEHDHQQALSTYETQMRQYVRPLVESTQLGGKILFGMKPFDQLRPF